MEQTIHDFGIQWPLLVASIVNFLILLYLLKRFLYKPILKVLDERKETIEKSLEYAKLIEEEKKATEEKMKASLRLANEQSIKTLEQANRAAEKIKMEIVGEAEKRAKQLIERAKAEIKQDQEEAAKSVRKEAAGLIAESLKQILNQASLKDLDDKMVKEALERIDG
jgi:F-type H+-transporting ATPase subunit b